MPTGLNARDMIIVLLRPLMLIDIYIKFYEDNLQIRELIQLCDLIILFSHRGILGYMQFHAEELP